MKSFTYLFIFCLSLTAAHAQVAPDPPITPDPQASSNPPPATDQTLLGDTHPRSPQEKVAAATRYLGDYLHDPLDQLPEDRYEELRNQVSETRDPGTQFGPYIFGLKKSSVGVLTDEQIARIDSLIEEKNTSPVNWHDTRNAIRMQSLIALWAYATEFDEEAAAEWKTIWELWNELRLAFMFQEFIAKEKFQRAVWKILTPEQRKKLIAGDYDDHIRKNSGHSRSFSAAKRVLKEFGEPDYPAKFKEVTDHWEAQWQTVVTAHEEAARFARQRELAMDVSDEQFARMARKEVQIAFDQFTHAERDAVRELVQAGYDDTPELSKQSSSYQAELRAQMLEKYSEHAGALLRMLGEI